jgi:hypothetical protein
MFDILQGDLSKVLGWLTFILETAMSPNVTPGRNVGDKNDGEDLDDPPVDTDDNDYTNPPEEED